MVGPAFALALQFYLNHRFGLVEVLPSITLPDALCGSSCLVLAFHFAGSYLFEIRARQRLLSAVSTWSGIASLGAIEAAAITPIPSTLLIIGSFLFGIFFMTSIILWIEIYCCFDNILVLLFGLLLTALSGVLCWFLLGLFGGRLYFAEVSYVLACFACMKQGQRRASEFLASETDTRPYTVLPTSLFSATFLVGFGLMYATCFISLRDLHESFNWSLTVYSIVLCASVFLLSSRFKIQMLYYLAAPLTLAGVTLSLFRPSFAIASPITFVNLGCYTYFVFIMVLNCSISHKQNLNPSRATALLVFLLFTGIYAGRFLFSVAEAVIDTSVADIFHLGISVALVVLLIVCLTMGNNVAQKIIIEQEVSQRFTHITEYDTDEFAQRINSIYKLSNREFEVLKLLLKGKTATQISEELVIAPGTAKAHISKIYRKLGIHAKSELFAIIPAAKNR